MTGLTVGAAARSSRRDVRYLTRHFVARASLLNRDLIEFDPREPRPPPVTSSVRRV